MNQTVYVLFAIFNRKELSIACLEALAKQSYRSLKIVVYDDGSTDGSAALIAKQFPEVTILTGPGNYWWSRSMNEGLKFILSVAKEGDFILTLNNDTEMQSNYVDELVESSKKMNRSIVGSLAKNFYDPSIIEDCGTRIGWNPYRITQISYDAKLDLVGPLDGLACRGTLVPIEVFSKIGKFNARWMPQSLADIDFFVRAKEAGFLLFMSYRAEIFEKELPGAKAEKFQNSFSDRLKRFGSIRSDLYFPAHLCFILRHSPNLLSAIQSSVRYILGRLFRIFIPSR